MPSLPRPSGDFTPTPGRHALQTRFLTALRAGATPPEAAEKAGARLATFYTWRRRNASFRQAWKKARAQARATRYDVPAPTSATSAASAAVQPKRLHLVIRSSTPGVPFRHSLTETWPDGRRTEKKWEQFPSREELLKLGEDPDLWEEARKVRESGADVYEWLEARGL
jgi:hypothetical protein